MTIIILSLTSTGNSLLHGKHLRRSCMSLSLLGAPPLVLAGENEN